MKKKSILLVTLLASTFLLAGCGNSTTSVEDSTDTGTTEDSGTSSGDDTTTTPTTPEKPGSGSQGGGSGSGGGSQSGGSGASSTATISYGTLTDTSAVVKINNTSYTYKASKVISSGTETFTNENFSTTDTDSNVILVCNGATLNLTNCDITKTGNGVSNSNDDYNFYGLNSAIICIGEGSTININNCKITTDAEGANAVFSFASANINITTLDISTSSNSSRGLYSTYNGTITATGVNIVTQGAHCADLATDRGGGFVYVSGENNYLEAHGDGSPCIYSTGDIEVDNATGYSEIAQTLVIEGKNIVKLTNSELTSKAKSSDGIMLYQSMSGDASDDVATQTYSTLTLENSKINYEGTTDYGLIFITNTTSIINLENTVFTNTDETMIYAGSARWGTSGSNGGKATVNFVNQTLAGLIATGTTDSTIALKLDSASSFTGTTSGNVTTA